MTPRRIVVPLLAVVLAALGVAAAPAAALDGSVTSFDGTRITTHWFPLAGLAPGATAPTVLLGPGWSSPGAQDPTAGGVPGVGAPGIADLQGAGYDVLTWDPRGFGTSGGTVESDSPQFEGRDAQALIDWVARQPGVQLDAPGDPRMGMAGGSYGGGIQLVTAALDKRVDAIVPDIAWHSLLSSLYKGEITKDGWADLLYRLASHASVDPAIGPASYARGKATGTFSPASVKWYASRGPGALVDRIRVPTLLLNGTVDGLFSLDEGVRNYAILRRNHVPTGMLWFCGGHGACLTDPGDPARTVQATLAWLARYVKRDRAVATGAGFEAVDEDGTTVTAPSYPLPAGAPLSGTGHGTLRLRAAGASGPLPASTRSFGGLGALVYPFTPAKAANAVDVAVTPPTRTTLVIGAPRLTLAYRGTVAPGKRPERVFAQLVDDATGHVLGNQVTPIPVTLDGRRHTVSRKLEIIVQRVRAGGRVSLQVVARTVAYAQPRLGGTVHLERVAVTLPTAR